MVLHHALPRAWLKTLGPRLRGDDGVFTSTGVIPAKAGMTPGWQATKLAFENLPENGEVARAALYEIKATALLLDLRIRRTPNQLAGVVALPFGHIQ